MLKFLCLIGKEIKEDYLLNKTDYEANKPKFDINLHKIGKKNEQLHELLFGYKPAYLK